MPDWQNTSSGEALEPLVTCKQILTALWQRAAEEGSQQHTLFEEWTQEVNEWARLPEWKAELKQKLYYGDNLWLPSVDSQEVKVLLGIATLADGLGCTVTQLAKAFMELRSSDFKQSSQTESSAGSVLGVDLIETNDAPTVEMDQKKEAHSSLAVDRMVDYQPLIEALNDWQATFELALDEAAIHLDNEHFPAADLSASLSEMCELLRSVLTRDNGLY